MTNLDGANSVEQAQVSVHTHMYTSDESIMGSQSVIQYRGFMGYTALYLLPHGHIMYS